MFKVLDVFKMGDKLSVTLEGRCDSVKNGSRLSDKSGNIYEVVSVGMTRHNSPEDISKNTTMLITPCTLQKGNEVFSVN